MNYIFSQSTTSEIIKRIEKLTPETPALWGKMTVAQMLAHCNVTYEMAFENIHPKPNGFVRFLLKMFVKETVVGDKPYKKNSQTAPAFIIKDEKQFEVEKNRLIAYLNLTLEKGEQYFEGKESLSFGKLNKKEWNNLFFKHLDHHLSQFGA